MHACEQVGVHHIGRCRFHDRLAISIVDMGFLGSQPARTDVSKVGAHRLRGQDRVAGGDCARQGDRALEEFAYFAHQCERRQGPRMTAGAGRHQDQTVDTRFQRLLRMADRNHVMQHDAAVTVDRIHHFRRWRAQAGDDDRHLMLDADRDVVRQAVIRLMDDLVDRDRPDFRIRMRCLVCRQLSFQVCQPDIQQFRRTGVKGRERTNDACLALRGNQGRAAGDEHRRTDNGKAQVLQRNGQCHNDLLYWV